jgi:hypothetical protein
MDWEQLLSLTVRLLDAHDSGHTPGTTVPIPSEERQGRMDGLWLNIATELLVYLNEYESATNESWVPLEEFVAEMSSLHKVSGDDVRWVVALLSTPTRLTTIRNGDDETTTRTSSTKTTALVERPRYKSINKCRLTRQGRTTVKLSKSVQGLLYSQYDAQKILLALQYSDFTAALDQADAINQEIRGFSQELTRLLEQPVSQETRNAYDKQKEAYLNAIQSVDATAEKALALFNTTAVKDEFAAWAEKLGPSAPSEAAFREQLRGTVRSVQSLSEHMQNMISELVSTRREVVGNVDFSQIALNLVFSPPSEKDLQGALMALGPANLVSSFPCAVDFIGTLPPSNDIPLVDDLIFDESIVNTDPPSLLVDFLNTHGAAMREALQAGKTVSLSKAITDGMSKVGDSSALSELVGVYVYPDWLGMDGMLLQVEIRNEKLVTSLPDGSQLWGDELVLKAIPEVAVR